jgi:hypothetical protein
MSLPDPTSAAPEPVEPTEIIHSVDTTPETDDGAHGESYNYLDYHFTGDGLVARARSYLDDIDTVVLHGPAAQGDGTYRAGSAFEARVIAYLKLRYRCIERLDPSIRTGRPYRVIWQDGDGRA